MASVICIEDEDEFDWEAAVREIDVACESVNPSTSHPVGSSSRFPHDSTNFQNQANLPSSSTSSFVGHKKKAGTCRQSTLDKFVSMASPRTPIENVFVADRTEGGDVDADEERGCIVDIDPEAAKTWIYPINIPRRDYQFDITKKALFANTLVALPTGLGKTLIAAVVMYNYFRWFPEGKIVFAAPSRPLVMQQIEACHKIVGIPQEWTIDMTGQTNPTKRAGLWKTKRVFFVTPQVLEKDIQSGTCLVKYLVCLVIDEAHRAMGNYSYCVAVRELMAVPVPLRILALTATPGSKQEVIQRIIDNLLISTLEYRDESDPDVSPYVHDRKIELIQVAMGKDAVEINNKLLEIIRPHAARLNAVGVLQNRDYQTLSPCDLLNSRDRFRQAPPQNLPQNKYDEVEKSFGALITMYHIRKLLSSHGIRPAYEMLEEKLKQGYFARLMSRNEDIWQAKLLMQKNLSHGAPSPKLSKMLEVLIDHFKSKDPQNSRVIIFSNFRGSVRDIMDALTTIGELVKATEFIGQSSGKTLKGQSQKVQQAVLEKFRAGGYNVIVATSIGEEGLDIMEVDLVVCFDANISPLRMIQRMGRTGRKHDGRVVVLACEGSELKGYMRKQSNSKSLKKHMRNGGVNSFNFHPSPRMIPHVFKPEAHLFHFKIDEFVPRGKKTKDDEAVDTPVVFDKLTDAENNLILKYFKPSCGNTWKPSLIAFPSSQSVPSRVHKVMHSSRAGMLIDSMQYLQGLSFSRTSETLLDENKGSPGQCLVDENVEPHDHRKDPLYFDNFLDEQSERETSDCEVSPRGVLKVEEKHTMLDIHSHNPPMHSYLFSSEFVSVDDHGKVLILSVPSLSFKEGSNFKVLSPSNTVFQNCLEQDSCRLKASAKDSDERITHAKAVADVETSCRTRYTLKNAPTVSDFDLSDSWQEKTVDGIEKVPETPVQKRKALNGETDTETSHTDVKEPIMVDDDFSNDFRNIELSPRLTNFIESGVVPESPINDSDQHSSPKRLSNGKGRKLFLGADLVSPAKSCTELQQKYSSPQQKEKVTVDSTASERDDDGAQERRCTTASPIVETTRTPLANLADNSCSSDWRLSSEDKSESVKKIRKFKRLRKIGDCEKNRGLKSIKENSVIPCSTSPIRNKNGRGKKKRADDAKVFIEEEAEVSSEAELSDSEEDGLDENSYDDSFIDDRINPSAASTQAESSRPDMMAIYRRSLLSQSPMQRLPNWYATNSPDSVGFTRTSEAGSSSRTSEAGGSSGKTLHSLQTPQTACTDQIPIKNSESFQMNPERANSEALPGGLTISRRENESMAETRKRKLSFIQSGDIPRINLEQEFLFEKESIQEGEAEKNEAKGDAFSDDLFFEGLDLDAVEAQATLLLKQKPEMVSQRVQNIGLMDSPSFDLGM